MPNRNRLGGLPCFVGRSIGSKRSGARQRNRENKEEEEEKLLGSRASDLTSKGSKTCVLTLANLRKTFSLKIRSCSRDSYCSSKLSCREAISELRVVIRVLAWASSSFWNCKCAWKPSSRVFRDFRAI